MPEHRSSGDDREAWDHPLVSGAPASTWSALAFASFAAAALAVLFGLIAPRLVVFTEGSVLAVVDIVVFGGGGILGGFLFWVMLHQADREIASGYTTLRWRSLRGSLPLVHPRTRIVVWGLAPRFDPAAARAAAPWAAGSRDPSTPSPLPPRPKWMRPTATRRWIVIVGIALIGVAVAARALSGTLPLTDPLLIGSVVFVSLLVGVIGTTVILRAVQVSRLSNVGQVASGIVVSGFSTRELLRTSGRLGLGKGVMPRIPVLVFDADGLTIWRGSSAPQPVIAFRRGDVISLDTTVVYSGRVSAPALEVTVIPPDERWPYGLNFTIFDPSRMLATANDETIRTLIASITAAWSH